MRFITTRVFAVIGFLLVYFRINTNAGGKTHITDLSSALPLRTEIKMLRLSNE